jgi:hypothetical protein
MFRLILVIVSVGITLFGYLLLVISAISGVIKHSNGALASFCFAIIIMDLGTGGFKAMCRLQPLQQVAFGRLCARRRVTALSQPLAPISPADAATSRQSPGHVVTLVHKENWAFFCASVRTHPTLPLLPAESFTRAYALSLQDPFLDDDVVWCVHPPPS